VSAPAIRPRLTYEGLCQTVPEGTLCELIDGEVFITPSPNLRHQVLVGRLHLAFQLALRDRSQVLIAPIDVVLAPGTVFQPDLVLVREENRTILQDVVRGVPDFVAEVLSASTARRDKGVKMAAYARFGVRECWIVSDENQTVEAYRLEATGGTYRLAETCRPGSTATTPLLPGLALDVAALFAE